MFHALAARFPFAARFRRTAEEWLEDICSPIWAQGCDLETLRKGAFRLDAPMVPHADRAFATPSGRFQFMTDFDPSVEPGTDPRHPYRLNAAEARRLGLCDAMEVMVSSPVGRIRALLRLDPAMRRDIVLAERGGWAKAGHGLNRLTRDISSRVGQGTPFYETSVSVTA
jgi:hypothetical protein